MRVCDGTFRPVPGRSFGLGPQTEAAIVDTVQIGGRGVLVPPVPADLRAFAAGRALAPVVSGAPRAVLTPPLPANTRAVRPTDHHRHGATRFRPWLRTALLASLAMAAGLAAVVATSTPAVAPAAPPTTQGVVVAAPPTRAQLAQPAAPQLAPIAPQAVPLPPPRPLGLPPAAPATAQPATAAKTPSAITQARTPSATTQPSPAAKTATAPAPKATQQPATAKPPAATPGGLAAQGQAVDAQAARVEKLAESLGISPTLLQKGDARLTSSLEKLPSDVRQMYRGLAPHYKQMIVSKLQGSTQVLFVTVNHRDAFITGSAAGHDTFDVLQDKLRESRQEGKIDASTASGLSKALEAFRHMSPSQRAAVVGLLEQDVARAR